MGVAAPRQDAAPMQLTQSNSSEGGIHMTELAHRSSNGIDVVLLWSRLTNRLLVAVADDRTGDRFTVDAPREKALDVFNHPFAYATQVAA
jgi:hypothetical protein